MNEAFLQHIWKYHLFDKTELTASTGEEIEIINVGQKNIDAGPDFFNAKVKIDNTVWAGNIEVHINSSDWLKHFHNTNKAYDNVILHVVYNNDMQISRSNGEAITTIELKFDKKIFENYQDLIKNEQWVSCENEINNVDEFIVDFWLNSLLIERLESKSEYILNNLNRNNNNWEETFYQQLAKNFGTKINQLPFEQLTKSLPLLYLAKHKNNLLQIEALLFGQAGFLEDNIDGDDYYNSLKKEYLFLKDKFKLKPIEKYLWKFLRLRPSNFPTIRIAQFASLIFKSSSLFSKIINSDDLVEIKKYFSVSTSEYWDTHYMFNKSTKERKKRTGQVFINSLIINTIVPFLFVYSKSKDNEIYKIRALKFLEKLPAEKNSIINNWKLLKIPVPNAFYSQALIQLKNEYCNKKKCLYCQIGNRIIVKRQ
ncbi:MAG: DUF2851 family protein [Bacteroidales bacterium]|nr:DUF2851 family protein [Bacteroidales bacterium]